MINVSRTYFFYIICIYLQQKVEHIEVGHGVSPGFGRVGRSNRTMKDSTTANVNKVNHILTIVVYYLIYPAAGLEILDLYVQNIYFFVS